MLDFEWRDIPGYPGYQVSNFGQVKSLPRVVKRVNNSYMRLSETILRPGPLHSGHLTVSLGRGNTKTVHSLVLLAFVGPRPDGADILHLDHNEKNNMLVNLRYGTRSENLLMDYESGVQRRARRVKVIHEDGKCVEFPNITQAAKAYGINQPTASMAAKNGYKNRKLKIRIVYVV